MNKNQILEGPIPPMLLQLSLPIFAGMIIQLVYNVTDTLWLSRIDMSDPGIVGGTGLIFPVMFLAIALANGLQTGISALTARSIGADNLEELKRIPGNGIFLAILLIVAVTIPTYLWSAEIMSFMGAEGSYYDNGLLYFRYIIPAAVTMFLSSVFNGILQGEGRMKVVMISMFIGTVVNLVLDPIFIFPLNLGVKGAALATVAAQICALLFSATYFLKEKKVTLLQRENAVVNLSTVKAIVIIGVPQVLSLALMAISTLVLNRLVVSIDGHAMTAFSLCSRFDSLQFIPILALSSALVTAVGQNYGRDNFRRIRRIWRSAIVFAGVAEVSLAIVLILLAPYIYPFFSDVDEVVSYAVRQTRTVNIFFTAAVFGILARSVFQGINNPLPALFLTMLRLIIVTLPMAAVFVYIFDLGVPGVWYGLISGSVISGIASFYWTENELRRGICERNQ
jgi:putative MATE family efflux protein